MTFQPSSRTSATWVWPQQMTRASVRVTRSTVTDGSSAGRSPASAAGRRVADQDQRVVGRSRRSTAGGAASRPGRRPAASCAHSAAARIASGHLLHPREGRRVVEVGDGDVGVARDDDARPRRPARACASRRADGPRAVEHQVAGDEHGVGPALDAIARAPRPAPPRCRGCRTGPRSARSSEHSFGRDDELTGVASQATSPSTLATPRPLPEPAAQLLHGDLEPERVARAGRSA